jgi:hypothetical protein
MLDSKELNEVRQRTAHYTGVPGFVKGFSVVPASGRGGRRSHRGGKMFDTSFLFCVQCPAFRYQA